jgi:hypothetical protein
VIGSLVFVGVLLLGWAFLSPGAAAAQPEATPTPEKQDYSNERVGAATRSPEADIYGYTVAVKSPAWIDTTATGTEITFSNRDDDYAGPIPVGFAFPFYEGSFSNVYVNTNGILTFGSGNDSYENRDIPRDTLPNNFIAPFWDDLILIVDEATNKPISRVFYKSGSDAQGKYFIVEWNKITRLDTREDVLTFQVILRENGNILIQYKTLSGTLTNATVGIEDDQGVDGVRYVYNAAGLKTSEALQYTRPAASARAKIFPLYRGNFVRSAETVFWFTVRNTGQKGTDTYDFQLSAFPSAWSVSFYDSMGALLKDTDGDGKVDTGTIAQGSQRAVKVKVVAPGSAAVGDTIKVNLSVLSSIDPTRKAQASFQAAVPAAFAQAQLNAGQMRLQLVWQVNQLAALAAPTQFTGSNLAVQRFTNGNYMYSWEQNISPVSGLFHADLKYTILSDVGGAIIGIKNLTDNSAVTVITEDRNLVSSVMQNGNVGTAWTRKETATINDETKYRYNVFFSVIDASGKIVTPALNVTKNTNWRGQDDENVPYYLNPRIATTEDNRFVITWIKDILQSSLSVINVEYVVLNSAGSQVKAPTLLTKDQPGGSYYDAPVISDMENNKALLSYAFVDPAVIPSKRQLYYVILNSSGNLVKNQTAIANSEGATFHDSVRLGDGGLLIGWASTSSGGVGFCILNDDTGAVIAATQQLTLPDYRDSISVSTARDEDGKGILTWGDRLENEHLYYVLIDKTGAVLTPAMIFLSGSSTNPTLTTNAYGYGLASYEGAWIHNLPITRR